MDSEISTNDLITIIPEIEKLSIKFSTFNPLRILGVIDEEIRHSHVIAWLLDPKANHGMGTSFFKSFMRSVLCSSENESIEHSTSSLKEIILGDFSDLQVQREYSHIDIFCVSEKSKVAVIIENKVNSGEHSDQLRRYLSNIKTQYTGYIYIPIFLSIEGLIPSHAEYLAASYRQVLDSIDQTIAILSDRIPQQIIDFIKYYKTIISEKIMTDPALKEIARKLYKENKSAIDFIHAIGNEIDLSIPGREVVRKDKNLEVIWPEPSWFSFADKKFFIKNCMNNEWAKGNPVSYWIAPYYGKLKICLEVGPFDSGNDRLSFLLELEKAGCKLRPSSKTETGSYTRLYTLTTNVNDWSDSSELEDRMKFLLENNDLKVITEIVKKVIENHVSFWK